MLLRHHVDGPPAAPLLVLGSSLGTTTAIWEPQLPMLVQRFRVVRWELPGHGGAPNRPGPFTVADLADDLVELLDHLGAERASLGGVSLGAMVAMALAARHPDRVERLVVACTAAHLPPASAWHDRAALVRRGGTAPLLPTLLTRWFTAGFPGSHPEVVERVAAMLAGTDPEGYAACCEAIAGMDLRDDASTIVAPTLVIAGADDPATPPSGALALHQAIAGSSLMVIAHAAHLANLEQPDVFGALLLDHLAGPPIERGRATRREVLGAAHVDRSAAGATAFNAAFLDLITRYAWGEIWTRPGLDRATRSCITLAMLTALGRFDELPLHVKGALRNGVTEEQITEVLLQAAIYCGVPAANTAFQVARRALDEAAADPG